MFVVEEPDLATFQPTLDILVFHILLIQEFKGVARGAGPPPIEMLFQVFEVNFKLRCAKMHYFGNKFSKIARRWGLSAPSALNIQFL